ncbi:MAG TPA: hypothetical protein PK306_09935, partial [Aquabacterium sp.]|nr:hypothetical protein [Aquabacterium sp.]
MSPLSFDSADMAWKMNQDTGLSYEQLFVADLSKAKSRGGKYPFISDSFLPPDSLKGELGVKMEIQVLEYSAYLSAMTTKTNAAGYFLQAGLNNPTTSLRKTFVSKQTWNPSQHADPEFDKKMAEVYAEPDERVRMIKVRLMVREILDKAPHIFLPVPHVYSAWWPWVKNYGGELRAGADRPGPIHARVWIDQEIKKKYQADEATRTR